jgi:uncharacterized membrane protein (UPF0127 family)
MAHWVKVINHSQDGQELTEARWCQSYVCRLRGLMFRRKLPEGRGLILVDSQESVSSAAIHMWAVFMDLGVVWINDAMQAVDFIIAKPWRIYFPSAPARFVLEGLPGILNHVAIGDVLEFRHEG